MTNATQIIIILMLFIVLAGLFICVGIKVNHLYEVKKEIPAVEIQRPERISAVVDNLIIFEKGKRYRLKGGKDVEFHVYEDNQIVVEFTVDDIVITRIGCIVKYMATMDTTTDLK
uniref:Uncharacterized protein n=1 Tax=viral metagenome TaxID=1070528 RepID=A0A6H1ZZD8_9ZZZZ